MGIYPSGIVYGIKIYKVVDNEAHDLFERKYNKIMNHENRIETKIFYESLPEHDKCDLRFLIYTDCSCPYEDDFMMWYPISSDVFLLKFAY